MPPERMFFSILSGAEGEGDDQRSQKRDDARTRNRGSVFIVGDSDESEGRKKFLVDADDRDAALCRSEGLPTNADKTLKSGIQLKDLHLDSSLPCQ